MIKSRQDQDCAITESLGAFLKGQEALADRYLQNRRCLGLHPAEARQEGVQENSRSDRGQDRTDHRTSDRQLTLGALCFTRGRELSWHPESRTFAFSKSTGLIQHHACGIEIAPVNGVGDSIREQSPQYPNSFSRFTTRCL